MTQARPLPRPRGTARSAAIVALLALLVLASGCGGTSAGSTSTPAASASATASTSPSTSPSRTGSANAAGPCSYPSSGEAAKPVQPPPGTPVTRTPTKVTITTDKGLVPVTLEADLAPCTVNSFLSLAKQGYFDDTPCHRLTTSGIYVLQCGDPTGTGSGGPGYSFADELRRNDDRIQPCKKVQTQTGPQEICTYPAGTVAMANAGADTNGSQFFLVYKASPLPNAYTVFGRMDASGLKTVQQIAAAGLQAGAQADGPPKKPVTIRSVSTG